jgi:hypothetical protein
MRVHTSKPVSSPGPLTLAGLLLLLVWSGARADEPAHRVYENRLTPIKEPRPLLADHPEFVEAIREPSRFEAPAVVDDADAKLHVRAWRYCYNARGIIEMPNHLNARATAVIVVHPWGIDDGQGWKTPEPAGVAFAGFPRKNQRALDHMKKVVNPLLQSLRGKVGLVAYSLPGKEDVIRKKLYRSFRARPSATERKQGAAELKAKLASFKYQAAPLPTHLPLSKSTPAVDYFRQMRGVDAGPSCNGPGFWDLPIPVARPLAVSPDDVVIYDAEGYAALKEFLQKQGIRHILLAGYHTDLCVCQTTAGYKNLARDFNVFLVGDATQATFPASLGPAQATTTAVSFAALDLFITQVSWIRHDSSAARR